MILEYAQELQPWSQVMFWFVFLNAVATGAFTVVVIIGGIFDLRFLFKALKEAPVDHDDDGRVAPMVPHDRDVPKPPIPDALSET